MLAFFLNRRKRCLLKAPAPHETLRRITGLLFVIFALHISAMMYFEGLSFFDSLWLTSTTIVTVGYGDLSAKTVPGRLSTMFLLYFCGIYVIADAASRVISWRQYKMERKLTGQWRWNMKDHIVIIGSPRAHADQFFGRLTKEIDASLDRPDIILLTQSFDGAVPECVSKHNAVHYKGGGYSQEELDAVDILHAKAVIILSDDETDIASDSKAMDITHRLHTLEGFKGRVIIELINDRNRERLSVLKDTMDIATVRPARGYPEMLVRAMVAPGSEEILENLFSEAGDEVCRVELSQPLRIKWSDLVAMVVTKDIGIPVGYEDSQADGGRKVVSNPSGGTIINTNALYVMVGDRCEDAQNQINQLYAEPLLRAV